MSVVDNFGNCKLNCRPVDLGFALGATLPVAAATPTARPTITDVTCYPHLTAVPSGAPGLIIGSSGTGFVELVIRGGSAAQAFNLRPGDTPLLQG